MNEKLTGRYAELHNREIDVAVPEGFDIANLTPGDVINSLDPMYGWGSIGLNTMVSSVAGYYSGNFRELTGPLDDGLIYHSTLLKHPCGKHTLHTLVLAPDHPNHLEYRNELRRHMVTEGSRTEVA